MTISSPPVLAHVLPSNATPYERLLASQVDRLLALDADSIRRLWNPWTCDIGLLPYLAWALSVDIWEPSWDDDKKRAIVAAAFPDHKIKGTEALIRRYVGYVGASVVQILTAPQGLYLDGVTQADIQAYLEMMPEIRIYLGSNTGQADDGLYLDQDFFDDEKNAFLVADRSSVLYGRMSTLHEGNAETALQTFSETVAWTAKTAVTSEQVAIPGDAGHALMLDVDFFDDGFLDGAAKLVQYVTYTLDTDYLAATTSFSKQYVVPGLRPQTPRWDREAKTGNAGQGLMLDADFLDDEIFLVPDNALYLIFDSLRLFDPSINPPNGLADGFLDDARLDMQPFRAEILINADRTASQAELYLDIDYFDEGYLVQDDLTLPNKAMEAIVAAKALRDTILVAFDTTRPITFGDQIPLDGSVTFGTQVARTL